MSIANWHEFRVVLKPRFAVDSYLGKRTVEVLAPDEQEAENRARYTLPLHVRGDAWDVVEIYQIDQID